VAGCCEYGNEPYSSTTFVNFSTSCGTTSFSRRSQLHGVGWVYPPTVYMVGFNHLFHERGILWWSFVWTDLRTSVQSSSPHTLRTVYLHRAHRHADLPVAACKVIRSSLGAFAKLRKAINGFVISVRMSVIMEQLGCQWTDFYKIWHSRICQNSVENFRFHRNVTSIRGTSREDQSVFMIISRSFLLRMRSVSDQTCKENQNKHFMFNNFLMKILRCMR
jgi:hypothetical protein